MERITNPIETNQTPNQAPNPSQKKVEPHKKKKKPNEDFKRKYFDYYDDIKISDRQDW